MQSYFLSIIEIREETSDAITICFKQPGLRKIKYIAGQYVSLNFRINGRRYSRAYSISSSPSLNKNLEISVKKVSNGIVSNHILNELKLGDIVEVSEPRGQFVYDENLSFNSLYFWAVGSGITPIFSIINELLNTRSDIIIHLIYGNKEKSSTIFQNQLEKLRDLNPKKFKMINFFSNDKVNIKSSNEFEGRISSEFVSKLNSEEQYFCESSHFICGPSDLKNELIRSLLNCGLRSELILFEDFNVSLTASEVALLEDCKAKILFEGKEFEFIVPKGKSVLDIALDNNLEISYSCQTGDCGSCKAILKKGELYNNINKLSGDESSFQYLLCCSYPKSSEIIVEID